MSLKLIKKLYLAFLLYFFFLNEINNNVRTYHPNLETCN